MVATVVEHVVVDAGAFIKRAPLHEIGKNIYTLKDVVDEIRDKPTKRSLAFLPYQLNFKEPFPEHVRFVTEFAKKTGDYPSLSATDIKVLALTYQLEIENVGTEHLKKEPAKKVEISNTQRHPVAPVGIAGFHFPSKSSGKQNTVVQSPPTTNEPRDPDSSQFNSFQFWRSPLPSIESDLLELLAADAITVTEKLESVDLSADSQLAESEELDGTNRDQHEEEEEEEESSEEEEEEDGDDGGGWITPSNIKQVQMDAGNWGPTADVKVGCVTTDFAMQNVLIQIGLHVLSVNGMLVKNTRNYILRCHACFKTTTNMNKSFCPNCGNNTLKKVAVSINEDGTTQMHFSRNPKVLNPKGKRYSLPLPQGGKHASNPHLVDDQRFPQQRLSKKAHQKTNVFDPDYLAGSSPFSEHDIYSRSASLQLRDTQTGGGRRRTNPNAARKKFVKK
ncbi:RNA-binding protein NOB1 [Labeo rohita]|uniref:RNA-binding protein NOB1 n=1 Tax=Labeo rohita TaxID=84645 RepID=A0ABQ8LRV1_LABRO|nr:RNA-binding protein NOB1 [Labeo rohita]KAI2653358.1 RNA-binding protein NOB1 [Labeo rohita]